MNRVLVLLVLAGCDRFFQLEQVAEHDAAHAADARRDSPVPVDMPLDGLKIPIDGPPDANIDIDAPACPGIVGCAVVQTAFCDGACFASCATNAAPATAMQLCSGSGGSLAKFSSLAQEQCARGALGRAWFALVQNPPTPGVPDDNWSWPDLTFPTYMNWLGGQPDDQDGLENSAENCAETTASGWLDTACATALPFVCRF